MVIDTQTASKNHYVQTFNKPLINNNHINYQQQANSMTNQRPSEPAKTMPKNHSNQANSISEQSQRIRRNLISFLHIYAILTISLYVTYAAYYFYQHQTKRNQQQQQQYQAIDTPFTTTHEDLIQMSQLDQLKFVQSDRSDELEQGKPNFESKFESKIHLLERYIELIAIDLQETKNRLKEREKCDCSLSCTFNGTKYAEHSSWQNQCDVCTCRLGKISCLPRKCPPINCDDAIQLPGQCCPTCMKKCKYNNTTVRHGHKFKPSESSGKSTKECKCDDGLVKCEQLPTQRFSSNPKESSHLTNSSLIREVTIGAGSKIKQLRTTTTNIVKS